MSDYVVKLKPPSVQEWRIWVQMGYLGSYDQYAARASITHGERVFISGDLGPHCAECLAPGENLCDYAADGTTLIRTLTTTTPQMSYSAAQAAADGARRSYVVRVGVAAEKVTLAQLAALDAGSYLSAIRQLTSGSPTTGQLQVQASSRQMMKDALADEPVGRQVYLGEPGREGNFVAVDGAPAAADPSEGMAVVVSPTRHYARVKSPAREFDAAWWGADGTNADETVPIQRAVDRVMEEGVGVVLLPGRHAVPGNIALPNVGYPGNHGRSITFRGKGHPPLGWGTVDGQFEVDTTNTSALDCSGLGSKGLFDTSAWGDSDAFRPIEVRMENMAIEREDNPAGPGIDGRFLGGLFLDGVQVHTGRYTTKVVQPTNPGATGIIFPQIGNAANLGARGWCGVQGFYTGIRTGEHMSISDIFTISGCWIGMEMPRLNDPVTIYSLSEFNNHIGIAWTGPSQLTLHTWDRERKLLEMTGGQAWQKTEWDIHDPDNIGVGSIGYNTVIQDFGPSNILLRRLGGNGLRYQNLRKLARPFFQVRADAIPLSQPSPVETTFTMSFNDNDMGVQETQTAPSQLPTARIKLEYSGWYDLEAFSFFEGAAGGFVNTIITLDGAQFIGDARAPIPGATVISNPRTRAFLQRGQEIGLLVQSTSPALANYPGGGPRLHVSLK